MRYYLNLFAILVFFNNFLKLEKLAQTSYTQFLINAKLLKNKSNNEILLERANALFFYILNKKQ